MEDVEATIISQYGNSTRLIQLITNFNQYVDQRANFDAFYNLVWNVDTAKGWGLDVWGRIVGVRRELQIDPSLVYFGFDTGVGDTAPFGSAPFYDGVPATSTYILEDDAYRVLILAKALSNISSMTASALNQLLQNLFPDRGRCYVNDLGGMKMRYTFEFLLEPFEIAVMTSSGVLPHGAGVLVLVFQSVLPVFGFAEMGTHDAAPFDQAPFYTPL